MKTSVVTHLLLFFCFICMHSLAQKKQPVFLAILPDNSSAVVTYKDGDSYILNLPDLSVQKKLIPTIPEDVVSEAGLSPDGKCLAVFHPRSKKIVVWNIALGTILFEVPVDYGSGLSSFVFDESRNTIICKTAGKSTTNKAYEFRVFSLTDGSEKGNLNKLKNIYPVRSISVSNDGQYIIGYSGASLNNGELEIFDYDSGEKICEKRMGANMQIRSATFFAADSIAVLFNQHMATTYLAAKFSIKDPEKNIGAANEYKETSLYFNYPLARFVVDDRIQVTVFNPSAHGVSRKREWLLVSTKKPDMLTLYDLRKTEAQSKNGKNWLEPIKVISIPLP